MRSRAKRSWYGERSFPPTASALAMVRSDGRYGTRDMATRFPVAE